MTSVHIAPGRATRRLGAGPALERSPVPTPGPSAPSGVPTAVRHVRAAAQAEELAAQLHHADRAWPVVVISTPRERGRPYVDPDRVLDEVRGLAEVVVIHTGDPSWAFSHGMPDGTQVYGGASRVYPVGVEWVHDVSRSPLLFAFDDAEGTRVHERLVQDALTAASVAGLAGSAAAPVAPATTSGTVLGIVGTRALVQTGDGTTAQVAQELTLPIVPIDRLLAPGMTVHGSLDTGTHRLDVRGMLPDSTVQLAQVHARYPDGAVVPAQVHQVAVDSVLLALAPAITVRVERARATRGDDDLRDLFSVGEVVAAHKLRGRPVPGPGGGTLQPDLRLDDVDDDDVACPALSLLDGGPPWLTAPDVVCPDDVSASSAATPQEPPSTAGAPGPEPGGTAQRRLPAEPSGPRPKPGPGPQRAVPLPGAHAAGTPDPATASSGSDEPAEHAGPTTALPTRSPKKALVNQLEMSVHEYRSRAEAAEYEVIEQRAAARALEVEVAGLRDLAREQRERLDRLYRDVERYKTKIRSARKERVPAQESTPPRRLFGNPVDQLRFDVRNTWAEIIGPEEKHRYPLPAYDVGPRFCDSLTETGRGLEDKIYRAIVLALTGRAPEVSGLELHRLRRGDGGGDPYLVRDSDGAQAMRLSLQVNSPQARRLHYWVLPGGGIELSRVVLHDDSAP